MASIMQAPFLGEPMGWVFVQPRFNNLLQNISLTPTQVADAYGAFDSVGTWLNNHYWIAPQTSHSILSGSWAKGTQVRPLRDVDMIFELPWDVFARYEGRSGNRQSQLLQEIKTVLAEKYHRTDLRGDGQAVVIPLSRVCVEVVPAFRDEHGWYWICDASDGGSYQRTALFHEAADIDVAEQSLSGCARPLIRMLKSLQRFLDIPVNSFIIERLLLEFLPTRSKATIAYRWYDWMIRDFLSYMINRSPEYIVLPGTSQIVPFGDNWKDKVKRAHQTAVVACEYEARNLDEAAGSAWQALFGAAIPRIALSDTR